MALVLPLMFMLSLGVGEYGYFFYLKSTFQGAAQAGARAAIPFAATNANVTGDTGVVTQMMTAAGIPAANYTVTLSPSDISGLSAGTQITVTIQTTWGIVGPNILGSTYGGISSSKIVKGVAIMQKESS